MEMQNLYKWEVELDGGSIITNTDSYDKSRVVRISYIPSIPLLPQHDIIFNDSIKFVRRFGRGFVQYKRGMKEYLHCVETDAFRFWLKSSTGGCLILDKDYELYL